MTKQEIRQIARVYRAGLTTEERERNSRTIADRLFDSLIYQNAKTIFCYVHTRDEVQTDRILTRVLRDKKTLCVPLVRGQEMCFLQIDDTDALTPGKFGILEPVFSKEKVTVPQKNDIIIVPGLAFDRNGYRVGYGGGFYDRFFHAHTDGIRVGLLFSVQLTDEIDAEPFDVPVDRLITEDGVYRCDLKKQGVGWKEI